MALDVTTRSVENPWTLGGNWEAGWHRWKVERQRSVGKFGEAECGERAGRGLVGPLGG